MVLMRVLRNDPIEELEEDSVVTMDIDLEKLYYNMVEARSRVAVSAASVG